MTRTDHLTADPRRLDDAIAHGPRHYRPIWSAVRHAGCAYMAIPQHAGPFEVPTGKPVIAIVGDDMFEALGPDVFHRPSIKKLLGTCRAVSIVACEPLPGAYAAVAAAAAGLRFNGVVIETLPQREADWVRLVQWYAPDAALLIATVKPEGGPH